MIETNLKYHTRVFYLNSAHVPIWAVLESSRIHSMFSYFQDNQLVSGVFNYMKELNETVLLSQPCLTI